MEDFAEPGDRKQESVSSNKLDSLKIQNELFEPYVI